MGSMLLKPPQQEGWLHALRAFFFDCCCHSVLVAAMLSQELLVLIRRPSVCCNGPGACPAGPSYKAGLDTGLLPSF
jgi:hypothetical protein